MRRKTLYAALILSVLLAAAGCSPQQMTTPAPTTAPADEYLIIDPEQRAVPQKIILYFHLKDSPYLVPVSGSINSSNVSLAQRAELVMKELMKGPQTSDTQLIAPLIPEGAKITEVSMTGSTAFVYFDSGITVQPSTGEAYANNQEQTQPDQYTRELLLYSIVNTLTELPGIATVKILIENHFATYAEMGLTSLAQANGVEPDTSMPSFGRSVDYILQPDDVVALLMNEWGTAQPKWDKIYKFLYSSMADGSALPGVVEISELWAETVRTITLNPESIVIQEMRGDNTALVAVSYEIERTNGQKQPVNLEYFHLVYQGGLWKLKLPPHLLDEDYVY